MIKSEADKILSIHRLILRIMLSVTGLPISVQGVLSTDAKKKILVANHVSSLDPFVLALFHPNILVSKISGVTIFSVQQTDINELLLSCNSRTPPPAHLPHAVSDLCYWQRKKKKKKVNT